MTRRKSLVHRVLKRLEGAYIKKSGDVYSLTPAGKNAAEAACETAPNIVPEEVERRSTDRTGPRIRGAPNFAARRERASARRFIWGRATKSVPLRPRPHQPTEIIVGDARGAFADDAEGVVRGGADV
jgi:hypothetical protein